MFATSLDRIRRIGTTRQALTDRTSPFACRSLVMRRLAPLAAAVVVSIALFAAIGTSPASAMSPQQTTLTGTINLLYWDLDAFWRWTLPNYTNYRSPTIGYYAASPTNVPACGGFLYDYTIMAQCPNGNQPQIWIHVGVNQDKVTRLGDYAAGFFLAHEWGHHIANVLGLRFPTIRGRELYADCMAGIFTRYGITMSHRLDAHDYTEGIWSLDDRFPNEGGPGNGYPTKADRKAWYQYGYTSYNLSSCAQAVKQ